MLVADLIRFAVNELAEAGIVDGTTDVQLLLGHCLGKSRTELFLAAHDSVTDAARESFLRLLARRKKREPLAYIAGEREFWSLPFTINPAVLIPRPETEFLVEQALLSVRRKSAGGGRILDLCTGSGVIAIVLALELGTMVTAVDISSAALQVAQENCRRHGISESVGLVRADLLSAFPDHPQFSLVVSNPPYVRESDVQNGLEPEVGKYEPHLALDGGELGLDVIQRIRDRLPAVMLSGGELFMEIGADQGDQVRKLFTKPSVSDPNFTNVQILKDYAGRDRVLHAILI